MNGTPSHRSTHAHARVSVTSARPGRSGGPAIVIIQGALRAILQQRPILMPALLLLPSAASAPLLRAALVAAPPVPRRQRRRHGRISYSALIFYPHRRSSLLLLLLPPPPPPQWQHWQHNQRRRRRRRQFIRPWIPRNNERTREANHRRPLPAWIGCFGVGGIASSSLLHTRDYREHGAHVLCAPP